MLIAAILGDRYRFPISHYHGRPRVTKFQSRLDDRSPKLRETPETDHSDSFPFLHSLERRVNRHGMTVSQSEIFLKPGDNFTGLHSRFEQTFLLGDLSKVFRRFAGFCLDVVDICLK